MWVLTFVMKAEKKRLKKSVAKKKREVCVVSL